MRDWLVCVLALRIETGVDSAIFDAGRHMDGLSAELTKPLKKYATEFPRLSTLHPFEAALVELTVGNDNVSEWVDKSRERERESDGIHCIHLYLNYFDRVRPRAYGSTTNSGLRPSPRKKLSFFFK